MVQSVRRNVASALTVLALAVSACGPSTSESPANDVGPGPRVEYVDGTGALHFASAEALTAAIDTLSRMSPHERLAWEARIGFKSQRSAFEEFSLRFARAGTQEEQDRLLREYGDMLVLSQDAAPRPRISSPSYAALINRAGLFFVDGVIHKVTPEWVISSVDGRRETVDAHLAALEASGKTFSEPMWTPAEGVRVVDYTGDTTVRALGACGTDQVTTTQNSDRRMHFIMQSISFYFSDPIAYYTSSGVRWAMRGEKKNLWGNWVDYPTTFEYRNIHFKLPIPFVPYRDQPSYYELVVTSLDIGYGSTGETTEHISEVRMGDWVMSAVVPRQNLIEVSGQATSRGLGGVWGSISCY